jgi:hypothetical protein
MPRPRQPDSKTLFATFRVSPQERLQLLRAADDHGVSFSDFLRLVTLGQADNEQNA